MNLSDDVLLHNVPKRYHKGFAKQILYSVTVELNGAIWAVRKKGLTPARVHLCPICSARFCAEQNRGNPRIDQGPTEYLGVPIVYRSDKVAFGVWVEPTEQP